MIEILIQPISYHIVFSTIIKYSLNVWDSVTLFNQEYLQTVLQTLQILCFSNKVKRCLVLIELIANDKRRMWENTPTKPVEPATVNLLISGLAVN